MRYRISLVLIVALAVVGCSDAETELSTTSSAASDNSLPAGGETTIPGEGDGDENGDPNAPTTTLRGEAITEHRQVHSETTANGTVIHLVIPRGGYTDIDVESFIRDLRQSQEGLWGVELFDDADAHAAFMVAAADRTDDQRTLLTRHHLVTLTEGETLIWRGPFSSLGQSTIGS